MGEIEAQPGIFGGENSPPAQAARALSRYLRRLRETGMAKAPFDANVLYGEAAAYTFVQAMLKAGKNPTRAGLVKAISSGLPQGAAVAPYDYSATDHGGMMGAFIGVIKNGAIVQQGPVWTTDTTPAGTVTAFSGSQPAAPASGMP